MIYLEMARDEVHGGGDWSFKECVWAPTRKRDGKGSWPFWNKVGEIIKGDTIVHLRGKHKKAAFVGYSTATTDGYVTKHKPPAAGAWDYSEEFFRADLGEFIPFGEPYLLSDIFRNRRIALEEYFDKNGKSQNKLNVFFVIQSGRLQCLNGAYLSDLDELLIFTLFGHIMSESVSSYVPIKSVQTGSQAVVILSRLGQDKFSTNIKKAYGNRCTFPGCEVSHPKFLVGSHISRWADNKDLRGELENGLCLCVFHDKAFEIGLFTLDSKLRVFVKEDVLTGGISGIPDLKGAHGQKIRIVDAEPSLKALTEHWDRTGFNLKKLTT